MTLKNIKALRFIMVCSGLLKTMICFLNTMISRSPFHFLHIHKLYLRINFSNFPQSKFIYLKKKLEHLKSLVTQANFLH